MAIRVSDRVQKSDEKRLVLEGHKKGEDALEGIAADSLAWDHHMTSLYISVKALKAPLMVVGPRIF